MPATDLLAFERVTAGYRGTPAVEETSLSVRGGEVVGLIGPNGSGKTTLVRVASRVLHPSSGSVRVSGRDPFAMPARDAARLVAVVPQEIAPTFAFTALEIVLLGRSPYASAWGGGGPDDYRRAREAMETTGVHGLADRPIDELSGGERQRVVLAQALAQDAPLLLLDEPTTHLDPGHLVAILEVVRDLARAGRGVLCVFHDLNLAGAVCDRIVALDRGRVVADGQPEDVLVAELLRDVYGVEVETSPHPVTGKPTVMLGTALAPTRAGTRGRIHVIGGAGRGAAAMRTLAEAGFEVTAGALHGADTDAEVADRLNLERVAVPPFSTVGEAEQREVMDLMREALAVVVADAPYGPGNVSNLRAALGAAEAGIPVFLLERTPMAERDFTGGEASALWATLAERGTVLGDPSELEAAIERRR